MDNDFDFLAQLINSADEAVDRLEKAKEKNNAEEINKLKLFILDIQNKIKTELERKTNLNLVYKR